MGEKLDPEQLKMHEERFHEATKTITELDKRKAIEEEKQKTLKLDEDQIKQEFKTLGYSCLKDAKEDVGKLETEYINGIMQIEEELDQIMGQIS